MKLRINFTLKTGVIGEIPVLAILNYGYKEFDVTKQKNVYKPLKFYTGIKVTKSDWNETLKLPFKKADQAKLLYLEEQMQDVFRVLLANGETITPTVLKNALDQKIKGKRLETIKRIRIIDFVEQDILTDPTLKLKTIRTYRVFVKYLLELEKQYGKPVYSNEFDQIHYTQLMDIVRSRSTRINGVSGTYRILSATLKKIAFKYKVPVFNLSQELSSAQKIRPSLNQKVYLTFEQIQQLIDYEPESKSQKNTKLIFLTMLFTGVRYSDVFKVIPEYNYDKDGIAFSYARFVTEKNGKEVIVPILKPLAEAFEANGGQTAYETSSSHFNRQIRILIQDCGLIAPQTLSYTDQYGKISFETKQFNEFVSSHTGRRSFVSNLISHVPVTILSRITTHAKGNTSGGALGDNNVIFTYNQTSLLDNAVLFFKMLLQAQETDRQHFPFELV